MARKQKRISAVIVSPVSVCVASILPVLLSQHEQVRANASATESRSATICSAIATLYAAMPDTSEYKSAVVSIFGNGVRGKENVKGTLAEELDKANVKDVIVRNTLAHARTVAENFGNADVRKSAAESGLRKARDLAKPKAAAETETPTTPAVKMTTLEVIAAAIKEHGIATVLGMVESCLTAMADPIRAQVVHDARVKVA